jgi:hypothetical protein
MHRYLVSALLSAVLVAAPAMAFAQTESTSSYLDTIPKKAGAHHASAPKGHGHQGHKHKTQKHHKTKSKSAKASVAAHGATAK